MGNIIIPEKFDLTEEIKSQCNNTTGTSSLPKVELIFDANRLLEYMDNPSKIRIDDKIILDNDGFCYIGRLLINNHNILPVVRMIHMYNIDGETDEERSVRFLRYCNKEYDNNVMEFRHFVEWLHISMQNGISYSYSTSGYYNYNILVVENRGDDNEEWYFVGFPGNTNQQA